jgi:hypothetical protein
MSIFRREALEYQCVRLAGTVSLRADRRTIRAAFGFVAFAALAMIGFTYMEVSNPAPLTCRVTSTREAVVGAIGLHIGNGTRLERIDINVGGRLVVVVPPAGDRGEMRAVPLGAAAAAAAGSCSATAHLVFRPGQLIVAKLIKKS